MARTRNIKPGFFLNDQLAALTPLTRILFAGLWCHADREGRLEDRPMRIKAEVLPYDDHDVNAALSDLESAGFIVRYKNCLSSYIQILAFNKHQFPNVKEPVSTIPAPDQHSTSTVPVPPLLRSSTKYPLLRSSTDPKRLLNLPTNKDISSSLPPDNKSVPAATRACARARVHSRGIGFDAKSAEAWDAYSKAYKHRWGVQPKRNAGVNSRLARLVDKLGVQDAPLVAAFYLTHNDAVYVRSKHCTELLLRDAEGLHTEFATGTKVTHTQAQSIDRLQTSLDIVDRVAKRIGAK